MINPFPIEDPALDEAIASAYADLKSHSADEEGYQKAVDQIVKLYKLKNDALQAYQDAQQFEAKHMLELEQQEYQVSQDGRAFWKRVDPNTALTVAGNIAIGLAVIKYEQTGVVSSKVWSFMKKF
jgi:predicted ATPase